MPDINLDEYNNTEANTGEYKKMPAGGYVCAIQAVRVDGKDGYGNAIDYVAEKMYVKLIWDIIEGDFAGRYSEDYWTVPEHDYGHQFFLSWKNMSAFKNSIQCLDESNPGFDALSAFRADKWELFVGKKLGLVIGEEEYIANDGNVKTRYTLPRIKSVQDIREGRYRVPKLKELANKPVSVESSTTSKDTYDDVPFM